MPSTFKAQNPKDWKIDPTWTLFLDRDGVLNKKIDAGYVCKVWEFEWVDEVLDSLEKIFPLFGRVVLVTNQQGIAKGLMTETDLHDIFNYMRSFLQKRGLTIDAYYYCPHIKHGSCNCRKPKTGMALQAKAEFPEIDFNKSVLVGDSMTDMMVGKRVGMKTIFVHNGDQATFNHRRLDLMDNYYPTLVEFASALLK